MDRDDPEKRIADLEHQLADQKHGADLPPAPSRAVSDLKRVKPAGRLKMSERQIRLEVCHNMHAALATLRASAQGMYTSYQPQLTVL